MTKNNKEVKLYEITLHRASSLNIDSALLSPLEMDAVQKRITSWAKAGIRETLRKKGLTLEFATVSKKVPALATGFLALTTKDVANTLKRKVGGIKSIRRA